MIEPSSPSSSSPASRTCCSINLVAVVFVVVGAIENAVRRHESATATTTRRSGASRFTIPVSVIVAAYNEETVIVSTVASLLALDYPEFEVVVVNDGSTDEHARACCARRSTLEPYRCSFAHVFPTEEVRGIYRSAPHPNLVVVDKENGGKADSLNAALNIARYRYVCGVDADTVFDRRALLKGMRLVVQDPARIIGVTSQLDDGAGPRADVAAPPGRRRVDGRPLERYQHLDFVRAFFNNRLAWSRLGFMLCSPGAFQIWRRDVLEEVGGYSTRRSPARTSSSRSASTSSSCGRVATTRSSASRTTWPSPRAPDDVRKLVSQRERWQRVIERDGRGTTGACGSSPGTSTVGLIGTPFYLLTEVPRSGRSSCSRSRRSSWPLRSACSNGRRLALVAGGDDVHQRRAHGLRDPFEDLQSRLYRKRDLARLLVLSPFDFLVYRPIMLLGAPQRLLGVSSRRQVVEQVRAERAHIEPVASDGSDQRRTSSTRAASECAARRQAPSESTASTLPA